MNLLAIDPGAKAGYAYWTEAEGYRSGVWEFPLKKPRNADKRVLYHGERFFSCLQKVRRLIRAHEIDALCVEHNVMDRSDNNAMLAGGFLGAIQTAIVLERDAAGREIFGPLMFTTIEWRSGYWGKYPSLPKEWSDERKRAEHKERARQACAAEGWEPATDDEAEALLMLVAFRKRMDPSFAFGRGGDAKAHQIGLAL